MPIDLLPFPALDSGAIAQAPVQLSIQRRIPRTVFPDGSQVIANLDNRRQYLWKLQYNHLSMAEQERFTAFLEAIQRGAVEFLFPDPLGNLLRNSEDLSGPAWTKSPGLEVGPIEYIPGRTSWILTNSTAIVQQLEQVVGLPSNYSLCFSIWATWTSEQSFALRVGAAGSERRASLVADAPKQFAVSERPAANSSTIRVAVEVPPNSQLIVSSPQLEIGLKPQGYVSTGEQCGVFTSARLQVQPILHYATSAMRRGLKIEVQGEQRI